MEWKEVSLGDLCDISSSKRIFAKEYTTKGVPFYRGKEIIEKQNGSTVSSELFITKDRFEEIRNKFGAPSKGELLLTSVGTLGVPYIVRDEEFYFKDGNLTWLRNFKGLDVYYLYYWFLSPNGKHQVDSRCIGSTQKALTIDGLSKFDITIPSLCDQRKISSILSSLDSKIETNNKLNAKLEELAQTIFKSWFVDFEPFKHQKMVDSELGLIPEGWSIENLKDVFYFQEGPGIRNWQYVNEDGIKFVNIRCISNNDLKLQSANMISREEAYGKYKHFLLDENDLIISSSGTLGRYAIVRKEHLPLCLNTSIIRFKPLQVHGYSYMYSYLTSDIFKYLLITMACGSVQANFGPTHLKQIKLIYPSSVVLQKYDDVINPIIEKIKTVKQENDSLASLRDTLLPKLMSGEIEI